MYTNQKKAFLKLTDEELMARVANDDIDELKILFERHHVHVYNYIFKMSRNKILSEDIMQEVFYNLMRYRATYNNGKFKSWLFAIARNSLKTYYRKNKEIYESVDAYDFMLVKEEEEENEDYSHLQKALSKLKASDRELLVLNRFQEIKYSELAEIVGSTPGAVKTKVSRALKKLKIIYFENL